MFRNQRSTLSSYSGLLTLLGSVRVWLLVGLALRILYYMEQSQVSPLFYQLALDELEVSRAARALMNGTTKSLPFYKAPFYTILVSFLMRVTQEGWLVAARLLQHLAGVGFIWMTADSIRLISKERPHRIWKAAPVCAAAFLAVYAPMIRLEHRLILDIWVVLFQSAMIWSLLRWLQCPLTSWKWMLSAGGCAALAWLTRPTITLVIPFLLLWILWSAPKWRLRFASLFLLPVIVAILGFGLRNHRVADEALFFPWQGGYDLWMSNRPEANGRYLVQPGYVESRTGNPSYVLSQVGFAQAVERGEIGEPGPEAKFGSINRYWIRKTLNHVTENPGQWLGLYLRKVLYMVNQEEIYSFESFEIQKQLSSVLRWLPPLGFGFLFPFALRSLVQWPGKQTLEAKSIALLWIYGCSLAGAIALYYASGRMRMPLLFPAVLLAAYGFASLLTTLKTRTGARMFHVLGTLLFLLGITLSWGDWWGVRSEEFRDDEYIRLSNAYYKNRDPLKALSFVNRAEEVNPDHNLIPLHKGQAYFAMELYEEAADAFTESLARLPSAREASYNLAIISWYYLDDGERALNAMRVAVKSYPNHLRLHALASIVAGLNGLHGESHQYLVRARELSGSSPGIPLQIAELVDMKLHGHQEEAFKKAVILLEQMPKESQPTLLDELRKAQLIPETWNLKTLSP